MIQYDMIIYDYVMHDWASVWCLIKYDYDRSYNLIQYMIIRARFFRKLVMQTFPYLCCGPLAPAMRYTMPRSIFCPTQGASSSNKLSAVHTRVKHSSNWSLAKDNKPNLWGSALGRPFMQKNVASTWENWPYHGKVDVTFASFPRLTPPSCHDMSWHIRSWPMQKEEA